MNNPGNVSGGRQPAEQQPGQGNRPTQQPAQKWQPDQSRLSKSGAPSAANSARTMDARGWGSGGAGPSTGSVGARPSTGTAGARPSTAHALYGQRRGTAFHRERRRTALYGQRGGPTFDRHRRRQPAHGGSDDEHFPEQVRLVRQPSVLFGQRVQRREQRLEREELQQPRYLQPRRAAAAAAAVGRAEEGRRSPMKPMAATQNFSLPDMKTLKEMFRPERTEKIFPYCQTGQPGAGAGPQPAHCHQRSGHRGDLCDARRGRLGARAGHQCEERQRPPRHFGPAAADLENPDRVQATNEFNAFTPLSMRPTGSSMSRKPNACSKWAPTSGRSRFPS